MFPLSEPFHILRSGVVPQPCVLFENLHLILTKESTLLRGVRTPAIQIIKKLENARSIYNMDRGSEIPSASLKETEKLFFDFSEKDTFITNKKRDVFIFFFWNLTPNMLKITVELFCRKSKMVILTPLEES